MSGSGMLIGGSRRMQLLKNPAVSSTSPFLRPASWTARASSTSGSFVWRSFTNSRAHIAPIPRTSPTRSWPSKISSNRFRMSDSSPFVFGSAFWISSTASSAAAHTTGLPPNVPPRLPGPGRSMTAGFPVTPPNGNPPPTALPLTKMSGTVFQCSMAHSFPVRPIPACTSSSTRTMPWASHSFRRRGKNSLGGTIIPPKEFFPRLRKLCDAHGIVLVDDEVQAGMGRTGKLWAIEHWNTVPDILVSGKAVGGGLPFGGVTGKPAVMDRPGPGSLGGTFGGNPVVCAAALEAIDEIRKALPKTKRLESLIRKRLDEIFEGHERVGEVRGIGAMWALEFMKDRGTKEPDVELARAVQLAGLKNGLVLLTAGFFNNCIRLLPPINIPLPLMTKALDLLEDSLDLALAGKAS